MNPDDLLKPYDLSPSGVREVQRNPATGAEKRLADATLGLLAQLCTLPSLLRGVVARDELPHVATSDEALASAIATLRGTGAKRFRLEWLDANDQVIRAATPEEDQAHLVVYQTAVARAHEGLDQLDAFEQLTQAHDADAKELTRLRMRVADLQGAQDALDAAREEARRWNARATELDAELERQRAADTVWAEALRAQSVGTWRVQLDTGHVFAVVLAQNPPPNAYRWTCSHPELQATGHGMSERRAIMDFAVHAGWPVVLILAPGEKTIGELGRDAVRGVKAVMQERDAARQESERLRAELHALPALLRLGVGGTNPPRAAKSQAELDAALALLRGMGRTRIEFLHDDDTPKRPATPEEDDAFTTVYQTALAFANTANEALARLRTENARLQRACDAARADVFKVALDVCAAHATTYADSANGWPHNTYETHQAAAEEIARELRARAGAQGLPLPTHDPSVEKLRIENARLQRACNEGLPREHIACPKCGKQHIDGANGAEFATHPHHTHLCQFCGEVFDLGRWSFGADVAETRPHTLPWGPVPTPDVIEAHAKAHPYVLNRECGDHECTDSACEVVPVGAWLVRTRHTNGTANLWHVTAWVHPDHGGGARCATLAWPDAMERLPEEFGRGVLKDVVETQWVALDGHGDPPAGASPAPKAPKLTGAEFLERASQAFPAIVNATDEEIEAAFGPGALGYSPEPAPATPVAATDADASAVVQAMQALVPLASQAYRHDVGGLEPVEAPVMLAHAGDREAGPELVLACSLAQDNPAPWTGYVVYDGPEGVEVVCAGIASPNALEALDELRVELDAACTPAPIRWGDVGTMEHDVDPDENDEG